MSLCLAVGGKITALAFTAFTLSWTHSVERVRWEEDWQLTGNKLQLVEARVKGSGAGMEPPANAVLRDGWLRWKPELPAQKQLVLAASGATSGGWTLCGADKTCFEIGREAAEPTHLQSCDRKP
ncbi:DUF1850 domain-containing protein [Tianweitania sp. BSSL-BM11]|uniref:DUF1850 domain-containing protein n=1 Tax=Tianweitania aestuarii TaxID=2814886 RepID=A0ABS5RY91_9HYPH|nr:DUF1850 domain-containing protein [Tianweitania aestuarii]MBS9722018.1 DUF1850 domain-containing protein [Tianweitania aestuarii]